MKAAVEVIVRQGLANAPMSQIAREAGVAAGTIYHYYQSKEELISELYRMMNEELSQALVENDLPEGNCKERFDRFVA